MTCPLTIMDKNVTNLRNRTRLSWRTTSGGLGIREYSLGGLWDVATGFGVYILDDLSGWH